MKLRIIAIMSMALFTVSAWSQETVKVLHMSVVRTSGQETVVPLYDTDNFTGPVVKLDEQRIVIDGRSMLLSRISEIRFHIEEVDGIEDIEVVPVPNNDVYSLDGCLVRKNAASLDGLPKGLYLMNGKKVVVTK